MAKSLTYEGFESIFTFHEVCDNFITLSHFSNVYEEKSNKFNMAAII